MLSVVLWLVVWVRLVFCLPTTTEYPFQKNYWYFPWDCRHIEEHLPDDCIVYASGYARKSVCLSDDRAGVFDYYPNETHPCSEHSLHSYHEISADEHTGGSPGVWFNCDSSKPLCPTVFLRMTIYTSPGCATRTPLHYFHHVVHNRCVFDGQRYLLYKCVGGELYRFYELENVNDCGFGNMVIYTPEGCYVGSQKYDFNCTMPTTTTVAPTTTTTVAPLSAADCRHTGQHLAGQCYYQPNFGWDAFKYQCLSNSSIALDTFSGGSCKTRFPAVGTLVSHSEYTDPLDGAHFMCDSSKPECPTLYFKQMYYTANCRTLTDSSERPVVYDRCVYADGTYMFYTCFSEDVLHKYYSATSCVDAMGGSPKVYVKDTCIQSHIKYDFDCTATTTAAP